MTKEEAIAELNELNHLRKAMDIQKNRLDSIQANIYSAKKIAAPALEEYAALRTAQGA